ncbi:hypothetical protein Tco_0591449 [Tanacetum coccineum]
MWRHYFYGTSVLSLIIKSLQHILDQKELNMRQRRWLELLSDYDCEISLSSEKANVVADALSRKERDYSHYEVSILKLEPRADGTLCLKNRSWIPCFGDLRTLIMHESHKSNVFRIHPRSTRYPRRRMPKPSGLWSTPLLIPVWKWENLTMGYCSSLRYTKDVDWSRYNLGNCRPPHQICSFLTNEGNRLNGKVDETILEGAARDRQKSYADRRRKPLEFQAKDKVMLKVSPWKGVIRFSKRGKLNPRYIIPFPNPCQVDTGCDTDLNILKQQSGS